MLQKGNHTEIPQSRESTQTISTDAEAHERASDEIRSQNLYEMWSRTNSLEEEDQPEISFEDDLVKYAKPHGLKHVILVSIFLVVCLISYVCQTFIVQKLQKEGDYKSPYVVLYISHSFWLLILPIQSAIDHINSNKSFAEMLKMYKDILVIGCTKLYVENLKRSGSPVGGDNVEYNAIVLSEHLESGAHIRDRASVMHTKNLLDERAFGYANLKNVMIYVAGVALWLSYLLNVSSYLWYTAVNFTSLSKVTALYNTSCFFAYLFSIFILNEQIRLSKNFAVFFSILGVLAMTLFDTNDETPSNSKGTNEGIGDMMSLVCACGVGLYQVLYSKFANPINFHSIYFINFVTSLLGVATLLLGWIPIPLLHFLNLEPFTLPTAQQLNFILINAALGIAYNASFLILLSLTSPLFAAVSVLLTIPIVSILDMVFITHALSVTLIAGCFLICCGFALLAYSQYHEMRIARTPH